MGRRSADQAISELRLEDLEVLCNRGCTSNGVPLSEKSKENLRKLVDQYRRVLEEGEGEAIVDS